MAQFKTKETMSGLNKTNNRYSNTFRFHQKLITYLFFFIISSVFWLLNTLNNTFTTNIHFPARTIHVNPNRRLVGDIPQKITINSTAHGYTLIKHIINSRKTPVLVSLMLYGNQGITNSSPNYNQYVVTKNLKDLIQRQFPELEIHYITPDTLYYQLSEIVTQTKPLRHQISLKFEKQHFLKNRIILLPDQISVTGPKSILDTIKSIPLSPVDFSNIQNTFQTQLDLIQYSEISYDQKRVLAVIPVGKYTESEIIIPITPENVPKSYSMLTIPGYVTVNMNIPVDDFRKLNKKMFKAVVNFEETDNSINNKVKVHLMKQPNFVWGVTFKPKTVEYLLEKK